MRFKTNRINQEIEAGFKKNQTLIIPGSYD